LSQFFSRIDNTVYLAESQNLNVVNKYGRNTFRDLFGLGNGIVVFDIVPVKYGDICG
jgi:hypothetical protein